MIYIYNCILCGYHHNIINICDYAKSMYIMHLIQPDYYMIYYPMLQAVQFSDFETNPPVVTHLYNPSSEHVDLRGIESFSHT